MAHGLREGTSDWQVIGVRLTVVLLLSLLRMKEIQWDMALMSEQDVAVLVLQVVVVLLRLLLVMMAEVVGVRIWMLLLGHDVGEEDVCVGHEDGTERQRLLLQPQLLLLLLLLAMMPFLRS